jgi:hypothetical protein
MRAVSLSEDLVMAKDRMLHLSQIGLICIDWALIEHYLEGVIWWELNIFEKHGREITSQLSAERRAFLARNFIDLRSKDEADAKALENIACYVSEITPWRNLAVHGVRSDVEGITHGTVTRGKWKYTPTAIDDAEMKNLIRALEYALRSLCLFMFRHGLLSFEPAALPDTIPVLLAKCHQPPVHKTQEPPPPPSSSPA